MITSVQLPRSTPRQEGVSDVGIAKFFEVVNRANLELHSMMLVRHGHVVAEHWWKPFAPDKPHMLFSLSKSFTSTAVGLAIEDDLLSENDELLSFFPEYLTPEIEKNMADVQVRHLLSMSTGHVEDTMPYLHQADDGDWVKAFLDVPIQAVPGTHFLYNTGATYILSAILQRVTGQTLLNYLTPRLFEPLGIANPTWETCPRGVNTGGFGLSIRTEDIAKFGQLYLQKGVWQGKQIISEVWVNKATQAHISSGDQVDSDWTQGYGYQFWRCRHNAYRGDGAFGQFCVVMPEQDAVVAITSGVQDTQGVLNAVWDTLLPAMSGQMTKDEPGSAEVAMEAVVDDVRGPNGINPDMRLTPDWLNAWHVLEDNPLGLKRVKFAAEADEFVFYAEDDQNEWSVRGGYQSWVDGQRLRLNRAKPMQEVAVRGGWSDSCTLVMAVCCCETPFTYTVDISSDNRSLTLTISVNVSFGERTNTVIQGTLQSAQ